MTTLKLSASKISVSLAIGLFWTIANGLPGQSQSLSRWRPNTQDSMALTRRESRPSIVFNTPLPPSTGRPGRRSDAGSRGCGTEEVATAETVNVTPTSHSLLALVPVQRRAGSEGGAVTFGKTTAAYPRFWFYVPQPDALTAKFVLQDEDDNPIYQTEVALPKRAGVVSVALPTTIAPLATGKPYHWFFKLYCRPTSPPNSFVEGWVQRDNPSAELLRKLKTARLSDQVRLYAADGFWFDALNRSAELLGQNPGDRGWAELLKAIGLGTVATETIAMP
jgi:hypothetical protein